MRRAFDRSEHAILRGDVETGEAPEIAAPDRRDLLDEHEEAQEIAPRPGIHPRNPRVGEAGDIGLVGIRHSGGQGGGVPRRDPAPRVLHDGVLPSRKRHERPGRRWIPANAERHAPGRRDRRHRDGGPRFEQAPPGKAPRTFRRESSHRTWGECIRPLAVLHLFGLTGGIASGKSTVAARFRSRGLPIIDADALAREVVAPGTAGAAAVGATFGAQFLDASGAVDRKALGRLVFSDPEARRRLNAITHPRIADLVRDRAGALGDAGEPLACYEAALIVENGTQDLFRPLVVVACPTDVQVARLRARDGLSEGEARARVLAQKPLAEKVAVADHVIDTAGSREATEARVDDVLRALCASAGIDPARYFGSSTSP